MIRILLRDESGRVETGLTLEAFTEVLPRRNVLLWLDMSQEPLPSVEPILSGVFHFHPLAIDDALHETHVPKVDEWRDYLYIVLRSAVLHENESPEVSSPELDVFLGPNFLVTYAAESIDAVDLVWSVCQEDERWLQRGPDYLLYRLTDELVAQMVSVAEQMHVQLDDLEEDIFGDSPPKTLEGLFTLKRNILRLRRVVLPQRDVLQKLSRNHYEVIDREESVFFRDVYDHLMRLDDVLDEMLILVGSALDTYLSVVNNRMNNVMKTLTIITAFFMPLGFITGFFGMNFFAAVAPFEAWTAPLAFLIALGIMILTPALMFWWMRRQEWV